MRIWIYSGRTGKSGSFFKNKKCVRDSMKRRGSKISRRKPEGGESTSREDNAEKAEGKKLSVASVRSASQASTRIWTYSGRMGKSG